MDSPEHFLIQDILHGENVTRSYTTTERHQQSKAAKWLLDSDVENTKERKYWIEVACKIARQRFGVTLWPWQSHAIADVCSKKDVIVSAGTGSGKSLVFQCLPYTRKGGIVLVISPLLSLIYDQVSSLRAQDISAVALTAEDIGKRPQLWEEVENGQYRLVYASPEVLLKSGSYFWLHLLRKKCTFNDKLVAVAIDEVHVVWGYREFRSDYENIGDLRAHRRMTPFLGLSATLAPNVLEYLHATLHLKTPVLYRRPIGRSNVTLTVAPIVNSRKSYDPLNFVIDSRRAAAFRIPKTFIFVDDVNEAILIARHLGQLLHPRLRDRGNAIIKVMTASLEPSTRSRNLDGLKDGEHRIFVGTEVVALGINFPDVEVIIQWGIKDHLTLASIWQRIGRAARDPSHHALAVIFVQELYLLPEDNDEASNAQGWYYGWRQSIDKTRIPEVQHFISRLYKDSTQLIRCPYDRIDPALIFLLNTGGCRWRAGLACFEDTSWHSGLGLMGIPLGDAPTYCCDNCFYSRMESEGHNYPDEAHIIHSFNFQRSVRYRQTMSYYQNLYMSLLEKNLTKVNAVANKPSEEHVKMAKVVLKEWRATEFNSWVRKHYPSLFICDFLSEGAIDSIIDAIHTIHCEDDLASILKPTISIQKSVLRRSIDSLLRCIHTISEQIPLPAPPTQPKRRKHDFEYIPESQLDVTIPEQLALLSAQRDIDATDKRSKDQLWQKKLDTASKKTAEQTADKLLSNFNEKAKRLNLAPKVRSLIARGGGSTRRLAASHIIPHQPAISDGQLGSKSVI